MSLSPQAIGGYFELELPTPGSCPYPDSLKFQSARAAFHALLDAGKPNRVWMPKYICDSMLAPLNALGIAVVFYELDSRLGVADSVRLGPHDWLLYVNYFGICSAQEELLIKRFSSSQLVFDHSQAFFFAPPRSGLATIFSPRKFFGIPDGGMLVTKLDVSVPPKMDDGSLARMAHLLKRIAESPESGYADYQRAEQTLGDPTPLQMSRLTRRMLERIDYDYARDMRNRNFRTLHEKIGSLNRLAIDFSAIDGPLCYPLLMHRSGLKERLISNRMFVPTYWTDVRARCKPDSMEFELVRDCIPLPCDQRYGELEMMRIVQSVLNIEENL